jgi:hypothetical protein
MEAAILQETLAGIFRQRSSFVKESITYAEAKEMGRGSR